MNNMSKVFIDSNILIYSQDSDSQYFNRVKEILTRLAQDRRAGVITPFVVNEIHYFYSKIYDFRKAKDLTQKVLSIPNIELVNNYFNHSDLRKIFSLSIRYKLRTFDAFHAYTCKKNQIKQIATFDQDFTRVKWLQIIN